jgi:tryptophan-rich hypothetical protein
MNPLSPKKLLLTKWTAVKPVAKQKHFLVSRVIQPKLPTDPIESVEIEAVFSKAVQVIPWQDLQDKTGAKCSVNFFLKNNSDVLAWTPHI